MLCRGNLPKHNPKDVRGWLVTSQFVPVSYCSAGDLGAWLQHAGPAHTGTVLGQAVLPLNSHPPSPIPELIHIMTSCIVAPGINRHLQRKAKAKQSLPSPLLLCSPVPGCGGGCEGSCCLPGGYKKLSASGWDNVKLYCVCNATVVYGDRFQRMGLF